MARNEAVGDNPTVEEKQQRRVESLGWLTESSVLPKKKRTIEGVGASSIVVLKAELYRSQEEAAREDQGLNDKEERRPKNKERGVGTIYLKKNTGVDERDHRDRLALKAGTRSELDVYATLEKKAEFLGEFHTEARYQAIENTGDFSTMRGEVSDEEGEEKYSVDFFQKGLHDQVPQRRSDWDADEEDRERGTGSTRLREPDSNDDKGLVSDDMRREQQRAQWESDSLRSHEDELVAAQRREEQKRVIREVPRRRSWSNGAAVPAPLTDDGVAVVDLRSYLAKIDREYATQRYAGTDAPLLYIRIQIGKATCSALIDCGASRNFMSQAFMARAGLGPRVRRKTQPTQVTLADGRTQKSIDRCVDGVPVYFEPLACEPVSFDILDTKFDMILGMSWLRSADHLVNFHDRTVHIRDRNGVLVPCTVATPHTSIACHVVSVARIRDTIAWNDVEEMGLVFLHALPSPDGPATSPPDPCISHLLDEYRDVFEAPTGTVPDRPIRHGITLEAGAVPPRGCIYRMSEEELEVLRAQLDDLLDKGWIRPSCSPYGAPVLFIRKKNKDLRLCIDYRKLNAQTVKNTGPLPWIDDLLERLGGATYFSKLDLKSGYHQIEIQPQDRYKTAFKTRYGHFEWVVMPFGLTNAPATFQAAMTTEFPDLLDRSVLIYLDDILVYSRTLDEHIVHLRVVLDRLRRAKYKANLDKCEFAKQELEYLGHFVTPKGIRPLADKIQAFVDWPEPRCMTDVRSFMGLAGYYRRFVESYSKVLLTDYLRYLPSEVRTKLVDEAYVEQHNFASFSKKALDIEAKLGSSHQSQGDGRKKRLPQDWKKKGQLMFVDHNGQTTEIDDFPDLGEETEHDGASETSDGGVVAPIKEKARGTGKKKVGQSTGQGDQGTPAWVKLGLEYEVWRDRVARGTCMNCGNFGHTSRMCRGKKVTTRVASQTVVGLSSNSGSASASTSQGNTSGQ
ncbi:hypothetical protein CBR_g31781 [Chara braunii]|uniref:CCHC-type domain-containing protein n=1 Tax=Chara braunii TaxID=69332 RepID=A0A388LFL5_CHABU|nr:hypothetical protein CBR_g31781 [Chara braunii]|eukprot:GBG81105.1 hypothetical protein CBR_g31781 [Chara braunii]